MKIIRRLVERPDGDGQPIKFCQNVIKDDTMSMGVAIMYGARLQPAETPEDSFELNDETAKKLGLRVGKYFKTTPIRVVGPKCSTISYTTTSWWQYAVGRNGLIRDTKKEFAEYFGNPDNISKENNVLLDLTTGLSLIFKNGGGFGPASENILKMFFALPGTRNIPRLDQSTNTRTPLSVDFNQGTETLRTLCKRDKVKIEIGYI